jgi:hypothetical protein
MGRRGIVLVCGWRTQETPHARTELVQAERLVRHRLRLPWLWPETVDEEHGRRTMILSEFLDRASPPISGVPRLVMSSSTGRSRATSSKLFAAVSASYPSASSARCNRRAVHGLLFN